MSSPTFSRRAQALQEARNRTVVPFISEGEEFKDVYGQRVFTLEKMKEKLPANIFQKLQALIDTNAKLSDDVAEAVAMAAFEWATAQGATHFCHWFQPQTGFTAEKHDSFLTFEKGLPILKFTGSQLMQGEPDASSFPSGGIRATHTARGYTAWDPLSPMFINRIAGTKTLCIPSVFVSYTGEALDEKLGLLRSVDAIGSKARELLHMIGDKGVQNVITTLGPEQEYFLVDKAYFSLRPDLQMTGRTLLGARPPRGQQLEDHYFGKVPTRVLAFMSEAEHALYRLGIPVKTRHNEVAPAQFEMAPIFENTDLAADHNQLAMTTLERVAEKHNFKVLLHEKPFGGINGSGKHCNWSLAVSKHDGSYKGHPNLLEPGHNPHENIRFLLFLAATLHGVDKHAGLMRAAIASAGNDHRLGANEAPPAIISAFLGSQLTSIVEKLTTNQDLTADTAQYTMSLGVSRIGELRKDYTDRNRTSPFAFTGNKFEFRAVGSSASVSLPMTLLNAAVADGLSDVIETLRSRSKGGTVDDRLALEVVREYMKNCKRICFDGNGYSEEWVQEAAKRGLKNLRKSPEALAELMNPDSAKMLARLGIFSETELHSRYHVRLESYIKKVLIEADTLNNMIGTMIQPAVMTYSNQLLAGASAAKELGLAQPQSLIARKVLELAQQLDGEKAKFEEAYNQATRIEDHNKAARFMADTLLPAMASVRDLCDQLENIVSDEVWPLPTYREMLFVY
jgi:glutamine synthetase